MMLRPTDQVLQTVLDNEIVVVHKATGKFFALTGTAKRAWEIMGSGVECVSIKAKMLDEFDVSEDRLTSDLCDFFTRMESEELIERVSA